MNNVEKAQLYDDLVRESDYLQRENSKIKSENAGNIPPALQEQINKNNTKISYLVARLESLLR